jgi:hypothetical protein
VRDNLAHLVDDETQHDHDGDDAASDGAAAQCSSTGFSRVGRPRLSDGNTRSVGGSCACSCRDLVLQAVAPPIEGLAGEVTIANGRPALARVGADRLVHVTESYEGGGAVFRVGGSSRLADRKSAIRCSDFQRPGNVRW